MTHGPGDPDRVAGQARWCLAAFPWRDRVERSDEIVGTVLDALPDDAPRLPLTTAVDLVGGGIRTRRQRRPPLGTRVAYRLGRRIHPRWIRWVYDDVEDPHYARNIRLRMAACAMAAVIVGLLATDVKSFFSLAITLMVSSSFIERDRHKVRARHGLGPGGVDPSATWVRRHAKRMVPNLGLSVLLVGVGLPLVVGGRQPSGAPLTRARCCFAPTV